MKQGLIRITLVDWVDADERTNHLGSAWKYFRTLDNRAFMHARRLSIYKYQITNGL